jgi:hypothetical protein
MTYDRNDFVINVKTLVVVLGIVSRLSKFFYSPTDAQLNCLKNNFKIYIKADIKTAPTVGE